jgi:hypothetical protein
MEALDHLGDADLVLALFLSQGLDALADLLEVLLNWVHKVLHCLAFALGPLLLELDLALVGGRVDLVELVNCCLADSLSVIAQGDDCLVDCLADCL